MKERILGRGLAMTLALAFSLAMLAAAIYVPATADWVMLPLMAHYAPPEDTRLPAEEYAPVVEMITGYLHGGNQAFQHIFTADGTEYAAFNTKEQHHMADVQDLFRLCRFVAWLGWGIVIFGGLSARRKLAWRTFRRTLIAIGAVGMVIAQALVARGFYLEEFEGYYLLLCICAYVAFFAISLGATIWVVIAEVFPNSVRSDGQVVGSMTHWVWSALLTWFFPLCLGVGGEYIFAFFAVIAATSLIFAWWLPETKGKSLEQIQQELVK